MAISVWVYIVWTAEFELKKYLKLIAVKRRLMEKRLGRSIQLRRRGLTYREIGRRVDADHSYIRRLILKHS